MHKTENKLQAEESAVSLSTTEDLVQEQEPVQEQQVQLSGVQAAYANIMKPEIFSSLLQSAKNIEQRFRGNAFTVEQVAKKMNVKDPLQIKQFLNMMSLAGLVKQVEIGGLHKFKITIATELRIATLENQLASIQQQEILVKEQINLLRLQLEDEKKDHLVAQMFPLEEAV